MEASSMISKCTVVVVAVMVTMMPQLQPSEAAAASPLLRFPGMPGTRQRNPGFPGFPGARPSPPSAPGFPGLPPPPPMPGSSSPGSQSQPQPPCSRPAQPMPGFPGLPGSSGGSSSSSSSSPTDCVTPLAGLMTCASFLTGSQPDTPTPQSDCCSGLGMFLNSSAAEDRSLRCLCPVILGDVNRMLPKPIDPVRMLYLPIACGVVLPPQVLFICFTGQPTPPVLTRIPDSWTTPSSAFSP